MSANRPSFLLRTMPPLLALVMAAAGCFGVALWAKDRVEARTLAEIDLTLTRSGHQWAEATADGLSVTLMGTAPDEATRFAALSNVGRVVDASRIIDAMEVEASASIPPPEFSVEILNNSDGISLIGLVPTESDPETIIKRAQAIAGDAQVTNLLESASFAPPPGWEQALAFGLESLETLPRSKVSIAADRVAITAVADSPEDKLSIEKALSRDAPRGVALALNISAPLPVIAPFTLRFTIDGEGSSFDACSADTEEARNLIVSAAIAAGLKGDANCRLGLGAPSTSWAQAVAASISTLAEVGQGTLTVSNADITLVAIAGTPERPFERAVGQLENNLPDVFSLNAVLTPLPPEVDTGERVPAEFVATRSPEGLLQLRGRLGDEATRAAVESFAAAEFGFRSVYPAMRINDDVPAGWPNRVLTGLEALGYLAHGSATVTERRVSIVGKTGDAHANSEIVRILTSRLSNDIEMVLNVQYEAALDPLAALPSPEECIDMIAKAAQEQKITFAPSSTEIEADAIKTIDAIAEILRDCQDVQIEIGGHTDSQGREIMNQQLSQARADSVLNAIMARRVFTSNLTAKGYGESSPIADNGTEAGREANRRIEFKLVTPEAPAEEDTAEVADTGEETE